MSHALLWKKKKKKKKKKKMRSHHHLHHRDEASGLVGMAKIYFADLLVLL